MLFFNLHNIFHFSLKGEIRSGLEAFFNQELSDFREKESPVDLEIELVNKIPDPSIVFYPNAGRDNDYFYIRDQYSNKIGIISSSRIIAESRVNANFLLEVIIEPLMLLNILEKGYSFLHASAVAMNNKAIIFSAFPKAGKTNIAVSLLKAGYSFLANDLVLVSQEGIAYSYQRPIALYPYNLTALPEINDVLTKGNPIMKAKVGLLSQIAKLQNINSIKYPKSLFQRIIQMGLKEIIVRSLPLNPKVIGWNIASSATIDKVFILFPHTKLTKPEIREISDKKVFASQLWANVLREKSNFYLKISSVYHFGFPEKKKTLKEDNLNLGAEIVAEAVNRAHCFELYIPERLSITEVFADCKKYIID